jgi:Zn-finger nucleic acid-binding protein
VEPLTTFLVIAGGAFAFSLAINGVARGRMRAMAPALEALPEARLLTHDAGSGVTGQSRVEGVLIDVDVTASGIRPELVLKTSLPLGTASSGQLIPGPADWVSLGDFSALALSDVKRGLPDIPAGATDLELRKLFDDAWPIIEKGSYPVISRGEAAWLTRLALHPAAEEKTHYGVRDRCRGVKLSATAERAGFAHLLTFLRSAGSGDAAQKAIRMQGEAWRERAQPHLDELRASADRIHELAIKRGILVLRGRISPAQAVDQLAAVVHPFARLASELGGQRVTRANDDARRSEEQTPCPACDIGMLTDAAGELGERVCPACEGRLIGADAVARVVLDPLGLTPGDIKARVEGASGRDGECPSCTRDLAPILLDDEHIVDVCVGCGSMWLDAGELGAVTLGMHEG